MSAMYTPDVIYRLLPWYGPLSASIVGSAGASAAEVPVLMLMGVLP